MINSMEPDVQLSKLVVPITTTDIRFDLLPTVPNIMALEWA